MRKYLAYYENEWPANIAELTAVENKPFVGYLKDAGVQFTIVPAKDPVVEGPADNEIWYTTVDDQPLFLWYTDSAYDASENYFGTKVVSNTYTDKGIIEFQDAVRIVKYHGIADSWPFTDPETESSTLKTIVLPNSVTSIGSQAFNGCYDLTSVTIGNSVTSIGDYAFSRCSSLTSITIPNSVTSIGWQAFGWCSGLTSVTIGNSVTSIGLNAFNSCSSLTSITIPNSVTNIDGGVFANCTALTSITYEGTIEQWDTITKGSSWNYDVPATHIQCVDGQTPNTKLPPSYEDDEE